MTMQPPTHVQMPMPGFEEYEPAGDCACRGCAQRRRALARARAIPLRDGGHPAARGARRALVLATAAGVVLGGGSTAAVALTTPPPTPTPTPGPAALDDPSSPQGARTPLHGPKGGPVGKPGAPARPGAVRRIDRATIINRAKLWLDAEVPYSMSEYWTDGYRQDCSGYVSMVWNLGSNEWTGSLDKFATKIDKDELLPGDMLLFHNPADPNNGSHVVIFGGWVDSTHTHYVAYEQTRPNTRKLATPYGYWSNATKYVPYRFNGVPAGILPEVPGAPGVPDAPGEPGVQPPPAGSKPGDATVFPGADKFGPGATNDYVAQLGRMLIERGAYRFYPKGWPTGRGATTTSSPPPPSSAHRAGRVRTPTAFRARTPGSCWSRSRARTSRRRWGPRRGPAAYGPTRAPWRSARASRTRPSGRSAASW